MSNFQSNSSSFLAKFTLQFEFHKNEIEDLIEIMGQRSHLALDSVEEFVPRLFEELDLLTELIDNDQSDFEIGQKVRSEMEDRQITEVDIKEI